VGVAAATLVAGCAGLAISLSASASASTHPAAGAAIHGKAISHSPVTTGSTWTLYDYQHGPGFAVCEVFSFGASGHLFTGDRGTTGAWKSNAQKTTLTFKSAGAFPVGKFTGSATFDGQFAGLAVETSPGKGTYGPLSLVSGSDPFGQGGC
jgi:hypothetical protein